MLAFRALLALSSEPHSILLADATTEGDALWAGISYVESHNLNLSETPRKNQHGSRAWEVFDAGKIVGFLYVEPTTDARQLHPAWLSSQDYPKR